MNNTDATKKNEGAALELPEAHQTADEEGRIYPIFLNPTNRELLRELLTAERKRCHAAAKRTRDLDQWEAKCLRAGNCAYLLTQLDK